MEIKLAAEGVVATPPQQTAQPIVAGELIEAPVTTREISSEDSSHAPVRGVIVAGKFVHVEIPAQIKDGEKVLLQAVQTVEGIALKFLDKVASAPPRSQPVEGATALQKLVEGLLQKININQGAIDQLTKLLNAEPRIPITQSINSAVILSEQETAGVITERLFSQPEALAKFLLQNINSPQKDKTLPLVSTIKEDTAKLPIPTLVEPLLILNNRIEIVVKKLAELINTAPTPPATADKVIKEQSVAAAQSVTSKEILTKVTAELRELLPLFQEHITKRISSTKDKHTIESITHTLEKIPTTPSLKDSPLEEAFKLFVKELKITTAALIKNMGAPDAAPSTKTSVAPSPEQTVDVPAEIPTDKKPLQLPTTNNRQIQSSPAAAQKASEVPLAIESPKAQEISRLLSDLESVIKKLSVVLPKIPLVNQTTAPVLIPVASTPIENEPGVSRQIPQFINSIIERLKDILVPGHTSLKEELAKVISHQRELLPSLEQQISRTLFAPVGESSIETLVRTLENISSTPSSDDSPLDQTFKQFVQELKTSVRSGVQREIPAIEVKEIFKAALNRIHNEFLLEPAATRVITDRTSFSELSPTHQVALRSIEAQLTSIIAQDFFSDTTKPLDLEPIRNLQKFLVAINVNNRSAHITGSPAEKRFIEFTEKLKEDLDALLLTPRPNIEARNQSPIQESLRTVNQQIANIKNITKSIALTLPEFGSLNQVELSELLSTLENVDTENGHSLSRSHATLKKAAESLKSRFLPAGNPTNSTGSVPSLSPSGTEVLEKITQSNDMLTRLNPLLQSSGDPTFILFPAIAQGLLSQLQMQLHPSSSQQGAQKRTPQTLNGDRTSFQRVSIALSLPALGHVQVQIAHRNKEALLNLSVHNEEQVKFIESMLPLLTHSLRSVGYSEIQTLCGIDTKKLPLTTNLTGLRV